MALRQVEITTASFCQVFCTANGAATVRRLVVANAKTNQAMRINTELEIRALEKPTLSGCPMAEDHPKAKERRLLTDGEANDGEATKVVNC